MFNHHLFEQVIATSFSGKNILNTLNEELRRKSPSDTITFRSSCLASLIDDLELECPRTFRKTDLDTILNVVWPASMFNDMRAPVMHHVFDGLMTTDQSTIRHRPERTNEYARFAATFDPSCLVAWHIACEIQKSGNIDCAHIEALVHQQEPFYTSTPIKGEVYTDGHVHLNGLNFDGVILMNHLWSKLGSKSKNDSEVSVLSSVAHTLLFSPRVQIGNQNGDYTNVSGSIKLRKVISPLLSASASCDGDKLEWSWVTQEESAFEEVSWHWLRFQIGRAIEKNDLARAWLWFQVFLWWHYQHEKATPTLRMCVHYLFGGLMRIRKKLIMSGVGLAIFKATANTTLRKSSKPFNGLSNARTLLQGIQDCAEIKVGADFFCTKKIREFLDNLCRARDITPSPLNLELDEQQLSEYQRLVNQWHLCVHFSRQRDNKNLDRRGSLWDQAGGLLKNIDRSATWHRSELSVFPVGNVGFTPGNWVRGFDVVGDENESKIEVYAPMLRWLRTSTDRHNEDELDMFSSTAEPVKRRYLSVHAGEDYAHPLSGMRHVDETVVFCEMEAGDRLGHALALGIDPRQWYERQGDVVLSASEHLDNLVWAWHYAMLMCNTPAAEQATAALLLINERIYTIAALVPWAAEGIENRELASILFRAWQYRKNCPFQFQSYASSLIPDPKINVGAPDHLRLMPNPQKLDGVPRPFSAEQVYSRRSFPNLNDGQEITVMVRPNSLGYEAAKFDPELKLFVDYDSAHELVFMHALQDYLLEHYRTLDLIIEVNPTSNIYIARLNDYHEHPIFRWSPPDIRLLDDGATHNKYSLRKGLINVTVNTDDPGIMPTTLRTEFSLLQSAARAHCASSENIAIWLEKLRLFGNAEFKEKHVSVWATNTL
jgi:hypothetical protein